MHGLKKLHSRTACLYFIVLVLLLCFCSCSSTPTYVYKEIPYVVETPALVDTITLILDTVYVASDSNASWSGEVKDSLDNVIGSLKVYYNRKIAGLNLYAKTDTFIVKDTIRVPMTKDAIMVSVDTTFNWWEKGIFYGGLMVFFSFMVRWKMKRNR